MTKIRLSPGANLALRIVFIIITGLFLVSLGVIKTAEHAVTHDISKNQISGHVSPENGRTAVYNIQDSFNLCRTAILYFALVIPFLLLLGWYLLFRPLARTLAELNAAADECLEETPVPARRVGLPDIIRILRQIRRQIRYQKEKMQDIEAALQRMREELTLLRQEMIHSEKLATVGKMTAGIMHEIGNPLAALIGYVELLLPGRCPAEQQLDFLQRIESELLRINQMIKDVLGLSRASSPCIESISLNDSIRQVLSLLSHQKTMQYVTIQLRLDHNLPLVQADAQQLKQILLNLFDNAVYAMPVGGTLRITSALKPYDKEVERSIVILEIEDTGTGIPPENLEKIFDPFFTTKPAGEGNGLGLSISRRIMESFGGEISVSSDIGAGTRFSLIFRTPEACRSYPSACAHAQAEGIIAGKMEDELKCSRS